MKKKILTVLVSSCVLMTVAGCSKDPTLSISNSDNGSLSSTVDNSKEEAAKLKLKSGFDLVNSQKYYQISTTGKVANTIFGEQIVTEFNQTSIVNGDHQIYQYQAQSGTFMKGSRFYVEGGKVGSQELDFNSSLLGPTFDPLVYDIALEDIGLAFGSLPSEGLEYDVSSPNIKSIVSNTFDNATVYTVSLVPTSVTKAHQARVSNFQPVGVDFNFSSIQLIVTMNEKNQITYLKALESFSNSLTLDFKMESVATLESNFTYYEAPFEDGSDAFKKAYLDEINNELTTLEAPALSVAKKLDFFVGSHGILTKVLPLLMLGKYEENMKMNYFQPENIGLDPNGLEWFQAGINVKYDINSLAIISTLSSLMGQITDGTATNEIISTAIDSIIDKIGIIVRVTPKMETFDVSGLFQIALKNNQLGASILLNMGGTDIMNKTIPYFPFSLGSIGNPKPDGSPTKNILPKMMKELVVNNNIFGALLAGITLEEGVDKDGKKYEHLEVNEDIMSELDAPFGALIEMYKDPAVQKAILEFLRGPEASENDFLIQTVLAFIGPLFTLEFKKLTVDLYLVDSRYDAFKIVIEANMLTTSIEKPLERTLITISRDPIKVDGVVMEYPTFVL